MGTAGGAGANLSFTGASGLTANPVTLNGTTSSTLTVPSGSSLELDGVVSVGTASAAQLLTFTGGGTLTLGGVNDNSSLTMAVQQGTVIITKTSSSTVHGLGSGTTTVGSGTSGNSARLQLSGNGGYDLYKSCALTVSGPDGVLDLNGQSDSMSTLTLSGAGPDGKGALINNNTTNSSLTCAGSGVVLAAGTTVGGSGNITLASKITGAGSLAYAGTGTLTIGNSSTTYSGGTTINSGGTVVLTNAANAAGTGTITDNGTLVVAIPGNNVILSNGISGSGTVNLVETSANNLQLGGPMSSFTGTLNCPTSPGGSAKAQILTTSVAIGSAATINLAAGGTLYVDNSGVVIPCPLNIYGLGNSETFGALRLENGALVSGPVTLYGNTTMGNGQTGASKLAIISGVISESGGSCGITFTAEPGTIVLSGVNSYTGPTTINGGVITLGGAGQLGSGNYAAALTNNATFDYASSAAQTLAGVVSGTGTLIQGGPGTLTLSGANTFTGGILISNNSTLAISGSGSLGADVGSVYAGNITNNGAFNYSSSAAQTLSGSISGSGVLTETGPGQLTLSGASIYNGAIVITNGSTLALGSGGSISGTASIIIAAGSTLDVSAWSSFTLLSSITLKASGTATTPATLKGAAPNGTVTLNGPLALTFTPQTFNGDATHPALVISRISAGQLVLDGNAITVNNAGASPLGAGTYSLIQVPAGGGISAGFPTVTVTGNGLVAGATASIAISGTSVNLVVTVLSVAPVTQMSIGPGSGGNLTINYAGGAGSQFVLLQTNDVTAPLINWTRLQTNTASPGSFSITPGSDPEQYYRVKSE
jgi:autotransporter-associated beta strand protein